MCWRYIKLSKLPTLLNSYNKSGQSGKIWLVNSDGWAMNGEREGTRLPDEVLEKANTEEASSDTFKIRKNGTDYMFQKVPKSDWYLVNAFGSRELLGEFWQFAYGKPSGDPYDLHAFHSLFQKPADTDRKEPEREIPGRTAGTPVPDEPTLFDEYIKHLKGDGGHCQI